MLRDPVVRLGVSALGQTNTLPRMLPDRSMHSKLERGAHQNLTKVNQFRHSWLITFRHSSYPAPVSFQDHPLVLYVPHLPCSLCSVAHTALAQQNTWQRHQNEDHVRPRLHKHLVPPHPAVHFWPRRLFHSFISDQLLLRVTVQPIDNRQTTSRAL